MKIIKGYVTTVTRLGKDDYILEMKSPDTNSVTMISKSNFKANVGDKITITIGTAKNRSAYD